MTIQTATPEDVRRLRAAIEKSGLSVVQYARQILIRNDRTVRRWLAGDSPIPEAVREFLRDALGLFEG